MVGMTWGLRSCGGFGSESQAAVVSDSSCMGGSAAIGVLGNSASVTVSQLSRYIRTNWGFLIPDGSFNPRLSSIRLRSLAVDQLAALVYGPSLHSSRHLGFFSRPLFGSCRRRGTCCSSLPTSHVSGSRATANQRRVCRTGASALSFLLTTSHVERQYQIVIRNVEKICVRLCRALRQRCPCYVIQFRARRLMWV